MIQTIFNDFFFSSSVAIHFPNPKHPSCQRCFFLFASSCLGNVRLMDSGLLREIASGMFAFIFSHNLSLITLKIIISVTFVLRDLVFSGRKS